jgi:ATP-dependent DNA helicase RecQ
LIRVGGKSVPDFRREEAQELLRRALGNANAVPRDGQWEAIDELVNRRGRMLVVQRTGWGKSMVYFVATKALRDRKAGPAVIVSPLLSLMRNQIEAAQRLGLRAATINSSNTEEWKTEEKALLSDEVDILLISPERLANDQFVEEVLRPIAGKIALLVIDEAHCISDWGHDFRPDYRRIVGVLRQLPGNVAVLATTATANARVVADVEAQLGGKLKTLRGPLVRDSLKLQVLTLPDAASRLAWLADRIPQLPGSGIVYALTVRDCIRVTQWLRSRGISASAYWGGQNNEERERVEQDLLANRVKSVVATTALGMGFDKPDLGFVVHFQMPGSVVFYYQQVGRAGRAIPEAYGVLMSGAEDEDINAYFRNRAFPPERHVEAVLDMLSGLEMAASMAAIEASINMKRSQIEQVLKLLAVEDPAPVVKVRSAWARTAVPWKMDNARIARLTRRREEEWAQMRAYISSRTCLMAFLASALDDPDAKPCGKCAVCVGQPLLPARPAAATLAEAQRFLRRSEMPLTPRKRFPHAGLPDYGWRGGPIPDALIAEPGRVLARWGEIGLGELIRNGKQAGNFPVDLVTASTELVRERWPEASAVRWVACIPSLRHPLLVASFAAELAQSLKLPFHPVVAKIRETDPQKSMENTAHQCENLDGVFAVQGQVPDRPVLLIDDVTDSGWTMAIVAGLLRQAGSGPVFPLALASAASE